MKGCIARLSIHRLLLLLAMATLAAFAATPVAEAQAEPCFALYEFAGGEACSDTWMADMAEVIGQRPLNQVVIPGAHDAATFQMNNVFWHQFGCPSIGVECLGTKAQFINQNSDFPEQLRAGMRWFDIRAQWTPIPPPPFGSPEVFDYFVNHGVGFTDLRLFDLWQQFLLHLEQPELRREILFLDLGNAANSPAAGDTGGARFTETCNEFKAIFGPYLITPALIEANFPGRGGLPEITMNELWSLPGSPRVITNWSGCVGQDGTWPSGTTGRYYANQCFADEIKGRIEEALPSRAGGNDDDLGLPVSGLYFLSVAPTLGTACLLASPNFLAPGQRDVITLLVDAWDRLNLDARANLNYVDGDYVREIDLAERLIPLNQGPKITASVSEVLPDGGRQVTLDCAAWDKTSTGAPLPDGKTNTVSKLSVTGAVTDSVSNSPTLTVDVPASSSGSLLVECLETSGAIARLALSDILPPGVTDTRTPLANDFGWNSGDVTVALNAVDNPGGSGIKAVVYRVQGALTIPQTVKPGASASITVSQEGTTTVTFHAVDNNDNTSETHTVTVQIDKTAPEITITRVTPANAAGWNNTDVHFSSSCDDALSGVGQATLPSLMQAVFFEGANRVARGLCSDKAGNQATKTLTGINIDVTPPVLTASAKTADGTPYTPGTWTNQDVTVTFACTDPLSGVASVTDPVTLTTEGADRSTTGTCTDKAGNAANVALNDIDIDVTPPVLTASAKTADGTPYTPGTWTNQDVIVTFACTDPLSGVASVTDPVTLTTEGANQSATGTCADKVGHSASVTFGAIDIDKSGPVLTCSISPNRLWPPNHTLVTVTANVTATDAWSGVAGYKLVSVTSNEPDNGLGDGDTADDIRGFTLGTSDTSGQLRAERSGGGSGRVYTLTYEAVDTPGNTSTCQVHVIVPHDQGDS